MSVGRGSRRCDARTTDDLIAVALTMPENEETDEEWEASRAASDAISALWWRGTLDVLKAARRLCRSGTAKERETGVWILSQLGVPDRTYPKKCLRIVLKVLRRETDENVLRACGVALGYLGGRRAITPLLRLKDDPRMLVRYGAVSGLSGRDDERAIDALIELSRDPAALVRDWATFGLAQQIDVNTKKVRKALRARLTDDDPETRAEAITGLVRQGDRSVVNAVVTELVSLDVDTLVVEAAGSLADPRLLPALLSLRERGYGTGSYHAEALNHAIECCTPETGSPPAGE